MRSKQMILIKNLLRANSASNVLKHEKDKKVRSKIIGNRVGVSILFIFLIAYLVLTAIGYGISGIAQAIPVNCAVMIVAIELLFTFLKANSYLFTYKEYDMTMALPFTVEENVASRFWFMYVKNLPWTVSISVSSLVGYIIYASPSVLTCILWLALSLLLPIIPMVIATAIGSLIAAAGAGFKHKQLIQTILTFAIILVAFASRFIIESIFRNNEISDIMSNSQEIFDKVKAYMPPAAWFEGAMLDHRISDMLLLVGFTILFYEIFKIVVSKFYRQINTKLRSHAAGKKYKMTSLKAQSPVKAFAFKEYRRFIGSTLYITNVGMGELITVILGVVFLFVDVDKIIASITGGAPVTKAMLFPAIPVIIFWLVGMCASTACSLSLEGKNLWIIKSLPMGMETAVKGKMLFNLYLEVPVAVFGVLCLSIGCGAGVLNTLLFEVCVIVLCAFSTVWGSHCDLKHCNFDWSNEVEVIKQGSAMTLYILPLMFGNMILIAGFVALGFIVNYLILVGALTLIFGVLTVLLYRSDMKLAAKM